MVYKNRLKSALTDWPLTIGFLGSLDSTTNKFMISNNSQIYEII
ncbi:hypothetical protein P872_22060 [Rhodonellum psychrophilum GCM71 = DSM 17998]|uniref:Uncharacterized protein n=1 Tax=Rhodonellum psychrophilum GCM71 = DSM 17998 TaxID=1123057 RepID=U5BQU4_9BACT|nr:hypothetical protein P872_22060 [Rhodonellum psychrophilum GCM71 = DSM 17998]